MKVAELKVMPVAILKPAEYNPRKKLKPGDKEYEKIKNSIDENTDNATIQGVIRALADAGFEGTGDEDLLQETEEDEAQKGAFCSYIPYSFAG